MISVRFGDELEKRVEQVAEARGMSVSAFIRATVEREVLAKPMTLAERLKGIAGSLDSSRTGGKKGKIAYRDRESQSIADGLWEEHKRKSAAWAKRRSERGRKTRETGRKSR